MSFTETTKSDRNPEEADLSRRAVEGSTVLFPTNDLSWKCFSTDVVCRPAQVFSHPLELSQSVNPLLPRGCSMRC
jgi:hypothetical protein